MNKIELNVIKCIYANGFESQRDLVIKTGSSLGAINKALKNLQGIGFLDEGNHVTEKAKDLLNQYKPQRAVILAAGLGMRMVPINLETPKALLKVRGEVLIERLIKQLKQAGIKEIYVVVGFMKEQFEYLIDMYDVKLIVNSQYTSFNNLHSLSLVKHLLDNCYVIPSDLWCEINPFSEIENYSWYMLGQDCVSEKYTVCVNRRGEITSYNERVEEGYRTVGIAYITSSMGRRLKERIDADILNADYDNSFWEEALFEICDEPIYANFIEEENYTEINTFEELKEFDEGTESLNNEVVDIICNTLNCSPKEITDIELLKKGMTNRSFSFQCKNKKYIMRIPGEGTDKLINRKNEAGVYKTLSGKLIGDEPLYINPEKGYKLTEYLDSRVCDLTNWDDVRRAINKLKEFHSSKLAVENEFNIFDQISFYESLWGGQNSLYRDYKETKTNVWKLKNIIDESPKERVLCHIDSVPDNFLFINGTDEIRLIDWEYAGMQDPHVDVAMFAIYSLYSREEIDKLIDLYFDGQTDYAIRKKIYCYIAACGLLWSNWCEYKRNLGIEFGEYSLRQYRYAKEYYRVVMESENDKNV